MKPRQKICRDLRKNWRLILHTQCVWIFLYIENYLLSGPILVPASSNWINNSSGSNLVVPPHVRPHRAAELLSGRDSYSNANCETKKINGNFDPMQPCLDIASLSPCTGTKVYGVLGFNASATARVITKESGTKEVIAFRTEASVCRYIHICFIHK